MHSRVTTKGQRTHQEKIELRGIEVFGESGGYTSDGCGVGVMSIEL